MCASADVSAQRSEQRLATVGATVFVYAVWRERVPPVRDAGRHGQPGRVPGGRVAAPRGLQGAGGDAGRHGATFLLHPCNGTP